MGIGLTFEEYVDLRLRPLAAADPVFSDAAERERVIGELTIANRVPKIRRTACTE